jgi:hypothetical protein
MNQTLFISLVKDFLQATEIAAAPADLDDLESLSFDAGGLTCRVFPHASEDRLFIEVTVGHLDFPDPARDLGRLLVLHSLNWSARFTSGVLASLSPDNELVVSKVCDAAQLDGARLAAEMALLLDCATHLQSVWEELAAPPGEPAAPPPGAPGQFV